MDEKMILQDHTLLYSLKDEITSLSQTVSSLVQSITSMKIDSQLHMKNNPAIPAGISTKISYDKNGLVTGGSSLDISDIPELPIEKIVNLRNILDSMITEDDITKLKLDLNKKIIQKGTAVNTVVKGNYDTNGLLIDQLDLLPSDIPTLSISKIEGLSEIIDNLKSQCSTSSTVEITSTEHRKVNAGTYPKITFDENGNVISGTTLSMNDIPTELITKVNTIESKLPNFALNTLVDSMRKKLDYKVDKSNSNVIAGEYSKVKVDKNGLVTSGDKLTIKDLPELSITDINGLDETLRSMITIDQFTSINDTVSALMSSISKIGDITKLRSDIDSKTDDKEFKEVKNKVTSMQNLLDKLNNVIPNDSIVEQLDYISKELSTLSGRITVIENKLLNSK